MLESLRAARKQIAKGDYTWLPRPSAGSPAEAIRKALDSKTTFKLDKTPLGELPEIIEAQHKIEVQIDRRSLDGVSATEGDKLSHDVEDISLRSALRLILTELKLTHVIRHESLIITSQEYASETPPVRLYPASDMLPAAGESDDATYDRLIEIITGACQPQSWEESGGAGTIMAYSPCGVLVVSQTRAAHEELEKLLAKLRKVVLSDPPKTQPKDVSK